LDNSHYVAEATGPLWIAGSIDFRGDAGFVLTEAVADGPTSNGLLCGARLLAAALSHVPKYQPWSLLQSQASRNDPGTILN